MVRNVLSTLTDEVRPTDGPTRSRRPRQPEPVASDWADELADLVSAGRLAFASSAFHTLDGARV